MTTYHYDQLGRPTVTTLPDGNTVTTAFSGARIVQMTDQVNRQTKRESDSLGRLTKVTEQDTSTGALTQETTYTYDIADHLIVVNQGNQTRAFKYDSQGRLLFERIPEMTATINDGTGTYWTTKYTYTDFGAVATKTDARGVVITYGYDTLNRLTSITYNAAGATGVDSTNNVAYNYDTSQTSETNGLLLSVTMTGPMAAYTETLSYDDSKRISSRTWTRDSLSYTTSYQYNTANQLTQMTYPVTGRTLNVAHDNAGRVSSLADQYRAYANNFTFNPAGQVTGLSLGNAATESYGYDTNRMQLISQTATQNGGTTNGLMNLHYYYEAAAGQMGAGTTAGNAGQLMSINNASTINGTTESAAYTYDDLGRLVTSNQTSNSSSAQRRFAYDRWGNRTGMWDATSGGTQIQSISLQQSSGVPTNRIASVTASGSTKNYSYDANGNLINDGVHVYTYDGENRLRTVDWGTANQASYVYDYANRRIKKYTGAAITYYVWEGNQVIGEYDATGATVYNYVYSGSRLIARMGSGLMNWYLSDRLSERLVLDGNGSVIGRMAHLPFGEDFGESGTQEKHHFTSYERDAESGTDYAVNRDYSTVTARFSRPDPLARSSDRQLPQSWNRYTYALSDPSNLRDPLGLYDDPLGPDEDAPCGLVGYIPIEDGWGNAFTNVYSGSIECMGPIALGPSADKQSSGVTTSQAKCSEWLLKFNFSPFDTKLAEAVFSEYSGNFMEGVAVAYTIKNRVWFLNVPGLTNTLGLGPIGATIEQVLGFDHQFPEYKSDGTLRTAYQALFDFAWNSNVGSPACDRLLNAYTIVASINLGTMWDPFESQGGSWAFQQSPRSPCPLCRAVGRLGVHNFWSIPYTNYTGGARPPWY